MSQFVTVESSRFINYHFALVERFLSFNHRRELVQNLLYINGSGHPLQQSNVKESGK